MISINYYDSLERLYINGNKMKWTTLNTLYSGIIGNSLFIISLAALVSAIPIFNFSSVKMSLALIGAILLSLSFVLNKIYIPSIVNIYASYSDYFEYLYSLKDKDSMSYTHEFGVLEEDLSVTKKLSVFSSKEFNLKEFESIDDYKILMKDRCLYSLSIMKFDFVNSFHSKMRILLSATFFIGITLLYTPTAIRIFELLLKGFK